MTLGVVGSGSPGNGAMRGAGDLKPTVPGSSPGAIGTDPETRERATLSEFTRHPAKNTRPMSTPKRGQHFTPPTSVVSRSVGDELVLVDLDTERYFSLNATGATIWEQLSTGRSVGDALSELLAKFDVSEETARADVDELVEALVVSGLLRPEEANAGDHASR